MLKFINLTLAILSRLLIIAGLILGYLSKKKMGVLRSMIYRNEKLVTNVFPPVMQYVFIGLMIAVFLGGIYLILEKKAAFRQGLPVLITAIMTSMAVYYVPRVTWIALPLVTLGLLVGTAESMLSMIRSLSHERLRDADRKSLR